MTTADVLLAGPSFEARQEVCPAPELGGAVIVRGLMAAEAFAVTARRAEALGRVHEARADHQALVREQRAKFDQRVAELPPGVPPPEWEPPAFRPPALTVAELVQYGRYGSELLHLAVVNPAGLALYTVPQWEVVAQHHPGLCERLRGVAERLSGLIQEDVEKNLP